MQNHFFMAENNALSHASEYIVVGIDGTSSREWMRPDGSNSHTYKFIQDFKGATAYGINKQWFHGTSEVVFDGESQRIVQQALDFIIRSLKLKFPTASINNLRPLDMFDVNSCKQSEYYNNMQQGRGYYTVGSSFDQVKIPVKVDTAKKHQVLTIHDVKIILIGHSRGCLAATVLAKMLSPIVQVYFMGLYDSVDRNSCLDSSTIENAKYVYHAMRSDEMRSRGTFGHSSTMHASDVDYVPKSFYTSHGGVGGDYVSDPQKATITGDSSCIPQPEELTITSSDGYSYKIDNTHPLARRFGKPINEICEDGKRSADAFIRAGARERGLPL
jgi:hypothetical protein